MFTKMKRGKRKGKKRESRGGEIWCTCVLDHHLCAATACSTTASGHTSVIRERRKRERDEGSDGDDKVGVGWGGVGGRSLCGVFERGREEKNITRATNGDKKGGFRNWRATRRHMKPLRLAWSTLANLRLL
jgi:hypothetical protein